jgi:IS1 family transposase
MNTLSRDKQIEIIAALCEGVGQRAVARLTDVDRKTVARLALQIGKGCAELHDRRVVGIRTGRLELDELWAFVGKKQKRTRAHETEKGDQYTYVALASTSRAVVAYRIDKRTRPPRTTPSKTFASACRVAAVARTAVQGVPAVISTSHVERSNLSLRMASRRFTRLTNGFSKKLENHAAAVSLYVAHYNLCRVHEAHRTTPAVALGIADHVWSIGELLDVALVIATPAPTETAPERRRQFRVIEGGGRP